MNDVSEHCLCDHCSGQDCQIFTEEEKEQNQKAHDDAIRQDERDKIYKRLEAMVYQQPLEIAYVELDDIECLFVELKDGD